MWAVVLNAYEGADGLQVEKYPVPKPGPGEILVKIEGTSIHPADLEHIHGNYGYFDMELPFIPGFVGCGTVVDAGNGLKSKMLKGRRV